MKIGELSRLTGVSVRMLRYYEEQRLLCPRRSSSGYRYYDEDAVDRVKQIRCLHAAALSTPVVRQVIACLFDDPQELPKTMGECSPLFEVLQAELDGLDGRIAQLNGSRAHLVRFMTEVRAGARG